MTKAKIDFANDATKANEIGELFKLIEEAHKVHQGGPGQGNERGSNNNVISGGHNQIKVRKEDLKKQLSENQPYLNLYDSILEDAVKNTNNMREAVSYYNLAVLDHHDFNNADTTQTNR